MAVTNGGAPAAPKWWQPFIGPAVGALLGGLSGGVGMLWATATDRADLRHTLASIQRTLETQGSDIAELKRGDREMGLLPLRIEGVEGRVTQLERFVDEARRADRATSNALTGLSSDVRALTRQVELMGGEMRDLRNARQHGAAGQGWRVPPASPDSSPATARPGDALPGFR